MQEDLKKLKKIILEEVSRVKNLQEVQDLKIKYLGRKSELTNILRRLKDLSAEDKIKFGKLANDFKQEVIVALDQIKSRLEPVIKSGGELDLTLPGQKFDLGHLHPLSQVQYQLEDVFSSMGFMIEDGPELESEYYNFEALNIPQSHPARDMQDTFYIDEEKGFDPSNRLLLRTQTSPVQIRAMKKYGAPLRLVVPGRCFRYEAVDVRHEATFYQLEGLLVDKNISLADMKSALEIVAQKLYGAETKVRLRPKFYPFVEPGVNGEVTCFLCHGQGCRLCKKTGWLEIFGAGLVHPSVLLAGGVDPKEYSGYAFGFGLTRLVMLKYGIDDVRLLTSGDLRFLNQF
ncbi:MAG: phenylalanine--tRNA ligase subunit alpha [Patescibacteria group bacterium]